MAAKPKKRGRIKKAGPSPRKLPLYKLRQQQTNKKFDKIPWEKVQATFVATFMTLAEVAERYKLPVQMVADYAHNMGWRQLRAQYRAQLNAKFVARMSDAQADELVSFRMQERELTLKWLEDLHKLELTEEPVINRRSGMPVLDEKGQIMKVKIDLSPQAQAHRAKTLAIIQDIYRRSYDLDSDKTTGKLQVVKVEGVFDE